MAAALHFQTVEATMSVVMLVVLVATAAAVFVAVRLVGAWLRYRGARLITCPENHQPAGVQVDARHAAATARGSAAKLRLRSCSRWPEKAGCGQECLRQIEASPEDCLVRNILVRWYAGKNCALCGKPIGEIHLVEQKPALLTPDRVTVEWRDVAAEKLLGVLETSRPVCFSCHLATSFARQHPDLAIDRSRPA
jgi:hypothetical protein